MKIYPLLIILTLTLSLISCGSDSHSSDSPENIAKTIETAHRDAEKVYATKEGSMAREHAILAIKVRESALRRGGHPDAANQYAETIKSILVDSLHIISE